MLRPALLLPPRRRPLTPRSGKKSLPFFLGPAIGLSGDYPSGTLTRRFGAARFRSLPRLRALACGCFRTHHAGSLPQASAEFLDSTGSLARGREDSGTMPGIIATHPFGFELQTDQERTMRTVKRRRYALEDNQCANGEVAKIEQCFR